LIWAIDFFAINTIWFIIFEEPSLTKMFGNEYRGYKRHIHRWLPQLRPYKPESES
jgi:protein-S-isoprenylcysteine O-methyltransferase Ste14